MMDQKEDDQMLLMVFMVMAVNSLVERKVIDLMHMMTVVVAFMGQRERAVVVTGNNVKQGTCDL